MGQPEGFERLGTPGAEIERHPTGWEIDWSAWGRTRHPGAATRGRFQYRYYVLARKPDAGRTHPGSRVWRWVQSIALKRAGVQCAGRFNAREG